MPDKITHSNQSTNLADILERVLDKGIVIAGDFFPEIPLLFFQLFLYS